MADVWKFLRLIRIRPTGLALTRLVEVWCWISQNVLSLLSGCVFAHGFVNDLTRFDVVKRILAAV